ncbi:hypothetical protein [Acinetobacter baumannii]|uniref:hypothetical protein n=1 Tax=Acinetobacter baumannii TaxID=470 RepID=UPI00201CDE4F|nr:hypothetical protein [Acinetobacter baumannii]MCL6695274.1 hypothetical protein [Acinetobacter baumannii]
MKTKIIQHYTDIDKIKYRYSELLKKSFVFNIDSIYQELTIIEIYFDLYEIGDSYGDYFTYRSFLKFIKREYEKLIGFIYFYLEGTLPLKYQYTKRVGEIFLSFLKDDFTPLNIHHNVISKELLEIKKSFEKIAFHEEKVKFYNGWTVLTEDNHTLHISLRCIYLQYGKSFYENYHKAIKDIALSKIKSTFSRDITNLNKLHSLFIKYFKNINELMEGLSAFNCSDAFSKFYNVLVLECLLKKECLISFHKRWRTIVNTYMELADSGFFEEPHFTIFVPQFKTSTSVSNKKIVGGNIINKKLITDIPLHYTDDFAKEIIYSNIQSDFNTCITIANHRISRIEDNYKYFESDNEFKEIQTRYLENPFKHERHLVHPIYLETKHLDMNFKRKLFGCVNLLDIYALTMILIAEHPQITESWLVNWRYFKNGKPYGYIEVDHNAYIVSHKLRKGENSLQKILLNEKSHAVVRLIIKVTELARSYLKSINSKDHEFMLLFTMSPFMLPKPVKKFLNPSTPVTFNNFNDLFFCPEALDNLDQKQLYRLETLAKNFSLTRLRATSGVLVYFRTNSINQMRTALGHSKLDIKLLNSYLPKPLWDYFTDRWIRIFQNILIYESLKDTEYLFDAIDIKESDLDNFLKNHHFGEIPTHIQNGKFGTNKIDRNQKIGVFQISVPILQIFIAIISFIESINENKEIPDFIYRWYQCAILVISQIKLSLESNGTGQAAIYLDSKILEMYKTAIKNPIDIKNIGWLK